MANERVILCGSARPPALQPPWQSAPVVRLRLGQGRNDVHLRIEHITRAMCANLPEVATDLVELAAFTYAADQVIGRGGTKEFDYGLRWRRRLHFEVPVRSPKLWQRSDVRAALTETLGFLSDDDYEFGFQPFTIPPPLSRYLFDNPGADDTGGYQEVVLFSGGLDSLAGAIGEILQGQRKVALVSHRAAGHLYHRQHELVAAIVEQLPGRRPTPLHVAVEVNKGEQLTRSYTQRSRSFLFASLAAVVARMFGLQRIRFYENGVTSLNLPISPQVLGGRASRTTHPKALAGFQRLFSLLFNCDFAVDNPFLWKTKAQVLAEVKAMGYARLGARSVSCSHTREGTREQPHCGRCSQCVDRRISALAAGFSEDEDPPSGYRSDVLTAPCEGVDLILIERYLATALRVEKMHDPLTFLLAYSEVARALRHVHLAPAEAAQRMVKLYQQHGHNVIEAVARSLRPQTGNIVRGLLPPTCLLNLSARQTTEAAVAARPPAEAPQESPARLSLVLSEETFTASYGKASCFLGNTVEFRLLNFLNERRDRYASITTLRAAVWNDRHGHTEKNTIQRTVSNIRRKLEAKGITAVQIDGSQPGNYRLMIG